MEEVRIGVIGGSGLYNIDGLEIVEEQVVKTPFGEPSDKILIGKIEGSENVAFLPRHGKGHRILPSELNARANIFAMKSIGVERLISFSAVGSLKKAIKPRDIVIPNQIIDKTKMRPSTFFGNGIVVHVSFADPFCQELIDLIYDTAKSLGLSVHKNETYVCMEGPQFSTRAESELHRSWGAGLIGMTAIPEAKLAREAEICYVTIALSTDYDCWYEEEDDVSVAMVVENIKANSRNAQNILTGIVNKIPGERTCQCKEALKYGIMTDPGVMPEEELKKVDLLIGKYISK